MRSIYKKKKKYMHSTTGNALCMWHAVDIQMYYSRDHRRIGNEGVADEQRLQLSRWNLINDIRSLIKTHTHTYIHARTLINLQIKTL